MPSPSDKIYLGDGAYAQFDGHNIVITTENGIETTNTIVLEPLTILALLAFVSRTASAMKMGQTETQPETGEAPTEGGTDV